MEIFQSIRYHFATIDICPTRCNWYNRKYLLVWFFVASFFISSAIYLLSIANSASEYADSFFGVVTGLGPTIFFSSIILKITQIFELIANFEKIIKKRKWKLLFTNIILPGCGQLKNVKFIGLNSSATRVIYQEANTKIEKYTKIFHFVWVKLSLIGIIVPYLSFAIFTYITTDNLNTNATFRLPFLA